MVDGGRDDGVRELDRRGEACTQVYCQAQAGSPQINREALDGAEFDTGEVGEHRRQPHVAYAQGTGEAFHRQALGREALDRRGQAQHGLAFAQQLEPFTNDAAWRYERRRVVRRNTLGRTELSGAVLEL